MKIIFVITAVLIFVACGGKENTNEELQADQIKSDPEWIEITYADSVFGKHGYSGSFLLLDEKEDSYHFFNKERTGKRFCPASSFKIPNSIFALESGAVESKDELIKWDGQKRWLKVWDQDHNLQSAYRNSVVWFYKEIARRIGHDRMQEYIEKVNYGNNDISGPVDEFWLNGKIRISQREQIDFLKKLYHNNLDFKKKNLETVKEIMLFSDENGMKIRAKSGLSTFDKVGWFVGWVEKGSNVYYFANNIRFEGDFTPEVMAARINITLDILDKFFGNTI